MDVAVVVAVVETTELNIFCKVCIYSVFCPAACFFACDATCPLPGQSSAGCFAHHSLSAALHPATGAPIWHLDLAALHLERRRNHGDLHLFCAASLPCRPQSCADVHARGASNQNQITFAPLCATHQRGATPTPTPTSMFDSPADRCLSALYHMGVDGGLHTERAWMPRIVWSGIGAPSPCIVRR